MAIFLLESGIIRLSGGHGLSCRIRRVRHLGTADSQSHPSQKDRQKSDSEHEIIVPGCEKRKYLFIALALCMIPAVVKLGTTGTIVRPWMGFAVVEIQATPNPNAAKFVLDRRISENPASFYSLEQAKGNTLAEKLMSVAGVAHVMLLNDFVTVGKQPQAR